MILPTNNRHNPKRSSGFQTVPGWCKKHYRARRLAQPLTIPERIPGLVHGSQ